MNLIPNFIHNRYSKEKYSGKFTAITAFIDISGFTEMTQNLMKNGKEGAEILTEIINKIFTPSIDAIYKNGGFISTFAGDAFTAIFHDDKTSTLLSLDSAWNIQQIFKKIGMQKTKFGDFSLAVKIGLSYGKVDWKIIRNNSQNIFYFRGNAINNCAKSEHHCQKSQIIFDNKIEAKIENNASFSEIDKNYFLLNSMLKSPHKIVQKSQEKISSKIVKSFVPQVIIDKKDKGEFRDIVPCFISFDEDENLDDLISEIITLTDKFGGYFNKVDFGDKGAVALVLFGAPIGREKLNERACDFALEVKSIAVELKQKLRMGITFGKIFAGFVGSERRSEYTTLGMTVNLSARFMMKADWNQLFIDRRIFENVNKQYLIEFLDKHKFKGILEEISVYLLIKRLERAKTKKFEGQLIGRKDELQKLKSFLNPLKYGKYGGIIYVDGIAGIGKSRLINELRESLDKEKYHWFFMPCDEILRKSFNPFVHFLNKYFAQSEENSEKINKFNFENRLDKLLSNNNNEKSKSELLRTKSLLGALINLYWQNSLYEQLDAKTRYENTLYAVKNLIKTICLQKPVIIELEDALWIDNDSLKLLRTLIRNVENFPFIIISACRFNDDESEFKFNLKNTLIHRLKLEYLKKNIAKKLIKMKFRDTYKEKLQRKDIPQKIIEFVWEKSSGNPFYIEQMILYLRDHQALDKNLNIIRDKMDIPSNINAIIIARLDRLTEEFREVIKTASVIGKEFIVYILSKVLQSLPIEFRPKNLHKVITEGETQNIWNSIHEIKYIFKYTLIRDSVYEIQLKERLRKLHKLVAETIEQHYKNNLNVHFEELAYHFEKAEENDDAIKYLGKAGQQAKDNFQNEKALELFERKSLQLLKKLNVPDNNIKKLKITEENSPFVEEFLNVQFDQKYFYVLLGEIKNAEHNIIIAKQLSQKLGDEDWIGKSYLDYGNILKLKGEYDGAIDYLKRALSIFKKIGNEKMMGLTCADLGMIYSINGDQKKALDFFTKQYDTFIKLADKRKIADAIGNVGIINFQIGNIAEAKLNFEKQFSIAQKLNDKLLFAQAFTNLGWIYEKLGNPTKSLNNYEKALQINLKLGIKGKIVLLMDNMGYLNQTKGHFEQALILHEKAYDMAVEIDDLESIISTTLNKANVYKNINQYSKASKYYDESLNLSKDAGINYFLPEIMIEKAETLFLQKKISDSINLAEQGLNIAKKNNQMEYIKKGIKLLKKLSKE